MPFLYKAHHNFLTLRTTKQYFSTVSEAIANREITKKGHKKAKYVALNECRILLTYSIRAETKGKNIVLFDLRRKHTG